MQKAREQFAEESATLAKNDVSHAASSNRPLGRLLANRITTTGKKAHPLRVCKNCSKNLRILQEKEKEKRLCCGVLIVRYHSACQSASNCTTQN